MKKNEYVTPEMEIVEMTEKYCILADSITAGGGGDGTPPGFGGIEE